jgi:LysM domain
MNQLLKKLLSPEMRLKTVAVCSLIVTGTVLAGVQMHRQDILSRTVTQARIAEGWKAAGIELTAHTIQRKENFWNVSRKYKVDVDTILGANPGLTKPHAELGQTIRVPNKKGVVHKTTEQETVQTIAALQGPYRDDHFNKQPGTETCTHARPGPVYSRC